MEKNVVIELESLDDLEKIETEAGKWEIKLVLIGGYAVRAYTTGYRYTKDMDFIAKGDVWKLKGFLNSLGYEAEEKKDILAGRKKIDGGYVDLHISIGEVFDISSGNCAVAGLSRHISDSALELAGKIRKRTFRKVWLGYTGKKMTIKEEQQIAKNLIEIAEKVKSS